MPAFQYHALDADGRPQQGVLQADTPRAARAALRERGLHPLRIDTVSDALGVPRGSFGRGLRGAQLALLTRQLATLVASGLPIEESLQAMAEGSEGRSRAQVVALRARVMEGLSLAAAMAEFPETFPALFRASVAAGESAGKLDQVLLRLADYAEQRDALRRRLLLALTYPALLAFVALAVVVGLMVWVVPQVVGVFEQYQQSLPWPTRALIALSAGAREYGLLLAVAALLVLAALTLGARSVALRARWHGAVLRVPVLGPLLRAAETARFSRTLALLAGSAVPLLDALGIATQVVDNQYLRQALGRVAVRVREGQPFARSLAETHEFSPVTVRLVASGEKSGRLDVMLLEAAQQQERDLDTALGVAMAALGPGVILLVGALVLFIVLAILLPIFELNTLIR